MLSLGLVCIWHLCKHRMPDARTHNLLFFSFTLVIAAFLWKIIFLTHSSHQQITLVNANKVNRWLLQ